MNYNSLTNQIHPAITQHHLRRLAAIYVRQSTPDQVRDHTGSAAFQKSLAAVARSYGWPDSQIVIIDADLGISGSSVEGRTGWQRLQELIEADQIGAVFAANMSRLSRRLGDFEIFRLRAAYHNTLLYIDGRFLNPADSNDAVVSQITAMVAQFENRKRTELMMQARWAKAKQGKVVSQLPIGWIKRADGQYDYDPAVKETITMIITVFRQTGSLARTVKQLAEARMKIPYRTYGRIVFRKITQERVRFILTHAAYAGTYIYGLTRAKSKDALLPSQRGEEKGCIVKHDNHPAYMSREEQAEIIAILESGSPRRSLRRGRCQSLINGFLRCASCGKPVQVCRPLNTHRFLCGRTIEYIGKPCFVFSSDDLEACILREVFKVLKTPPTHVLKKALAESRAEKRSVVSRLQTERERLARDECSAQERIESTLGARPSVYFDALEKLEKVLQEKERFEQKSVAAMAMLPKDEPTQEELNELSRIAAEVPALWQNHSVTDEERKGILRHVIDHILIAASKERIDATIVWKSGSQTSLFIWRALHRRNLVRELHDQKLTPYEIREHLAAGKTSTGQTVNLCVARIQTILLRMGLKPARYTASYLAARDKVVEFHREGRTPDWIARYLNERGFASANGRPWTAKMVGALLYALGHRTDLLNELHYRLISEGRSRGLSYRQIANLLNKKNIRRLGVQTWTARNVETRWKILKKRAAESSASVSAEMEASRALLKESA